MNKRPLIARIGSFTVSPRRKVRRTIRSAERDAANLLIKGKRGKNAEEIPRETVRNKNHYAQTRVNEVQRRAWEHSTIHCT